MTSPPTSICRNTAPRRSGAAGSASTSGPHRSRSPSSSLLEEAHRMSRLFSLWVATLVLPALAPAPNAPGLWVVHSEPEPLFTAGAKDRGKGLGALAEDGNPADLAAAVQRQRGIE